jgi:excisionase family DNA binding protein
MEKFYLVAEISEMLKVSTYTLYEAIKRGELECIRIGGARGAIRIKASALDAYIELLQTKERERRERRKKK